MPVMRGPGDPTSILSDLTPNRILNMTFNGVPPKGPGIPDQYGCEIIEDFRFTATQDKVIVNLKVGMQGWLINEGVVNDTPAALIEIPGVTNGPFHSARWVPRRIIKKGALRKDLKDWPISIAGLETRFADPSSYQSAQPPDNSMFGKTVSTLVQAIYKEQPSFIVPSLFSDIDHLGGPDAISKIIIQGVRDAGLYDVFNAPNFTADQLRNAATYRIHSDDKTVLTGIYARWNHSHSNVPSGWSPNTDYLYVGYSRNMNDRYKTHKNSKASYGELNRHSEVRSFVLCLLPDQCHKVFLYVAEQILICTLSSFRKVVYTSRCEATDVSLIYHAQSILQISQKAFQLTGWKGATKRESFGIDQGANLSMPLAEYGKMSAKLLWVRTDAHEMDPVTRTAIPMAYFRRATLAKRHRDGSFSVLSRRRGREDHFGFSISFPPETDGLPFKQACQIVMEFRKDGQPHSRSYVGLPDIPRFQNWNLARSFAIRVEWENPKRPGKWRFAYAVRASPTEIRKNNIEASLESYARGIEVAQVMLHQRPPQIPHWIAQPPYANILVAQYNYMDQTILFRVVGQRDQVPLKSCARLSHQVIKKEMQKPVYQLENVGHWSGVIGARVSGKKGHVRTTLRRCDVCCSISNNHLCEVLPDDQSCCKLCRSLGLPCCTRTPDVDDSISSKTLRTGECPPGMPADRFARMVRTRTALVCGIHPPIPEDLQDFEQRFTAIQGSNVGGYEDDNEDDNEDEDADEIEYED